MHPSQDNQHRSERRIQRRFAVLAASVVALGAVGFFLLAASAASQQSVPAWDQSLLSALIAVRSPLLTAGFRAVTLAGEGWFVAVLTIAAAMALLIRGKRAYAALLVVAMSAGWLVESLVKSLFHRARPPASVALIDLPVSFSFPSGHAFVSLVLYALVVYAGYRLVAGPAGRAALAAAAVTLVLLVGVSRVYLGVHWPSDVLASWCLAIAWVGSCLIGFAFWRARPKKPAKSAQPSP